MAQRKPGYRNNDGNRNVRNNRYGDSGQNNDVAYRYDSEAGVSNNKNRQRFTPMPRTP